MTTSRLGKFLLTSIVALLVLIVPWYYLAPYLAVPVIAAAGELMQLTFGWATGYEQHDTVGTLLTTLRVFVSHNGRMVVADMAPEVDYRTYGYGLVLFWALLLASRSERMWAKMALGTVILAPSQAISMCFRWLKEALLTTGPAVWRQAGLPDWTVEVIAYGYQFGFLMLTPLMPVLLWAVLDKRFVRQVWAEAVLAGAVGGQAKKLGD